MRRLLLILLATICVQPLFSQTLAPVLFYSDLDSGPATGGQGGNGAFVCVYGENFSSTGTMTIGGATATVILWTDPGAPYVPAHYAKACGQLASGASAGPGTIQLTTTAGSSNTLPFTVRSGNIYFASPSGSDITGNGSYGNPFGTITFCKNFFSPGDICVAGIGSTDTFTITTAEIQSWGSVVGLLLNSCGTAGNPKTIVAYPGNSVTYDLHEWIDPSSNQKGGGRALEDYNSQNYTNNCGAGKPVVYWTIAGLTFDGNSFATELTGANFRIVDNTMQCTGAYCDGPSGGLVGGTGGNIVLFGNRVNKPGCGGANTPCASGRSNTSKLYHTVYLGQGNNETLAYNEIIGGTACRGVQFHSPDSGGNPQQNIQIYNNVIHDSECDGLNLATVNPSAPGGVNVYNNVIYNAGIGPNPSDGIAHYSCFYSAAYTGNGTCTGGGSGAINAFNNTFYNCGGVGLTDAGAIGAVHCAPVTVALNNNLIVLPVNGIPYATGSTGVISAQSNDCYGYSTKSGASGCPSSWGGTEWSFDPAFVNAVGDDFHLNTTSQAVSLSVTAPAPANDADGLSRVSPNSLGAYELAGSAGPNPGGGTTPQLNLSCTTITYDGNPHSCTGSAAGNGGAAVSGSWSYSPASEFDAGYYAMTGIFASSDPSYSGGVVSSTLLINRVAPTVSFTGAPASAACRSTFTVSASTSASTAASIKATGACTIAGSIVTMTAGTGTCSLTAAWAADTNHLAASATQSTTATEGTTVITWATPAAITYGTALSAIQLNARATYNGATVSGSFSYAPAEGTVLGAAAQNLSVIFTPANSSDYTTAAASVTLQVNPAKPKITWVTPAAIAYGTALSSAQLNPSASVPGSFTYSPAAGTVLAAGIHTLSATFITTDTDYTSPTATVTITVTPDIPSLAWPTPAAISFGTALSSAQLNATASVPGSFTYSPAAGSVLAGGSQTLSVTFTPTDKTDYTLVKTSVTLQINSSTPTITWATPAAITYGTALSASQLNARATYNGATVSGSFSYAPAKGTVLGAAAQNLSVIFTPANSSDYTTAAASVTLQVNPAKPKITWVTPAAIAYGTALSSAQLNPSASVPGSFTYSPAAGTVLAAGIHTLSATFITTDTDYTSPTATVTITVTPDIPSLAWPTPAAISFGTALSSAQLNATASVPGSFTYSPAAGSVLAGGSQTLSVTFTPTDKTDYTLVKTSVTLQINSSTPTITWATPAAITYGTALGASQLNARATYNSATVSGSFSYSPANGTVLGAGLQPLSVLFTPANAHDYGPALGSATLQVNPAKPKITWVTPAAIAYGTPLSSTQLNATTTVPGSFAYSTATGTVLSAGAHTLSVTFNTIDMIDYTSSSASVTLTVTKAASTTSLTSSTPNPSEAGQALTFNFSVTGTGVPTGQVTVTASTGEHCAGTLSAGAGSCSLTFATKGSRTLTASYAGDTNFKSSSSGEVAQIVQPMTCPARIADWRGVKQSG